MTRPASKHTMRVQTMFTRHQYGLLQEHAEKTGRPLSIVIREALQKTLIADLEKQRKEQALEWLFSQELPVDDWEAIERQIETRWKEWGDE